MTRRARNKNSVRIELPVDNYGRVYVGLLEGDLSSFAKLCFGVLWSFGANGGEAWASMESISKRMSVAKGTALKAQRELEAAGWITLLEGSAGRNTKIWQLHTAAKPVTACPVNGSPDDRLTDHVVTTNKEVNQERNQVAAADAADTPAPPDQRQDLDPDPTKARRAAALAARGAILGAFRTWWLAQAWGVQLKYVDAPGDGRLADKLVAAGVTADDLAGPLAVWPANSDDYTKTHTYPFWLFCRQFTALQVAARGARPACAHPIDRFVQQGAAYRDGTRAGVCGVCGAPVTHRPAGEIWK